MSFHLVYLIDFMFTNATFPHSFKGAEVVPIFKSGLKHTVLEKIIIQILLSPFLKLIKKS